jgi:exosortase C (VPDSG-CTERM-specific)
LFRFAALAGVLTLCFTWPLSELVRFALGSSLFSHVLLVPLVSVYLIRQKQDALGSVAARPSLGSALLALAGIGLLLAYWLVWRPAGALPTTDYLAVMTTAYLALLVAAAWLCLGTSVIRAWAFPLLFLGFMIPWPNAMIDAVETGLQYPSAEATAVLLRLTGTPFLRDGLVIELPGIVLQVAQECSGVRSSLVLLITSVLAGHVLLRTRWKRWVLAFVVLPLGIVRNGFRILTISLLCVHVSPKMIDSPIHHSGGPVFFALSLVPFFLLLLWLRRTERQRPSAVPSE